MLTRKTPSHMARTRFLLVIPVLIAGLICCAKTNISYERKKEGNKITYKGNVFEMTEPKYDSTAVVNPATGKQNIVVTVLDPRPVKMNGQPIMYVDDVDKKPVYKSADADFSAAILDHIKSGLEQLEDGRYGIVISNLIIDEQGNLAYYELGSINKLDDGSQDGPKNKQVEEAVLKTLDQYLSGGNISFSPASHNGQAVPCSIDIDLAFLHIISVTNHKARIIKRN